jgi:hypothetical protein
MKCTIEECERHQDCGFLEIIKKLPISKDKCSWFKKTDARKNKSTAHQSAELGAETASGKIKRSSRAVKGKSVEKQNAK